MNRIKALFNIQEILAAFEKRIIEKLDRREKDTVKEVQYIMDSPHMPKITQMMTLLDKNHNILVHIDKELSHELPKLQN